MVEPYTIQRGRRKAVITGKRVALFTVKPRNKKKPLETQEWPEMAKPSAVAAWNAGLLWVKNAYIELGERQ